MKVLFLMNRITLEGEPIGVMQLSAVARARGWASRLTLAVEDYLAALDREKPDLLAVSMMSTDHRAFRRIVRECKRRRPDLPVLVGGPHPTFVPDVLRDIPADAACVGEGDQPFQDVLARIEAGKDLEGIPNIQTRTGSRMPLRPLIENLDTLPFVDRDIVYGHLRVNRRFKMRSFLASRGCPYHCSYCFNHAYNRMYSGLGNVVRRRSVENLIAEIEAVSREYPTAFIRFADDAFLHRLDPWIETFSEQYRKRVHVPFYCLMRANSVTPDMVKLLKEAGCVSVCMSIECANPEIRTKILQRDMTTEQLTRAFDLFNEAGIHIYTNSMVGLPTATPEDELATLDLNIRCRPKCGHFTTCVPFPGTDVYEYCTSHGLLDPAMEFNTMPKSAGDVSILKGFSAAEKRFQRNLALLGPLVIYKPHLRNILLRVMRTWPSNAGFVLIHYLTKNYLFSRYIVPLKLGIIDVLVFAASQLRTEMSHWFSKPDAD